MELGLGVWTNTIHRYPVARILDHGGVLIDPLDGLIFIDSESNTPAALFVNAKSARMPECKIKMSCSITARWFERVCC
jgi:hypothetical protein